MTYEQQLNKLQADKGLTIPDADFARKILVAFYHFDEQLRSIFLKYILQVERHLKSMISYHFTEKYGESQTEYLNPNNFDYTHHSKQVKRLVDSLSKTQLHQFITVIAKCRNVCAHGERLFDFRTTNMIPDTLLHSKLGIPCKKGLYQNGKKDLFSVVIALRYLISDSEFKIFRRNLGLLIKDVLKKCPHLTEDQLLKEMGFPKNWAKITRYKK